MDSLSNPSPALATAARELRHVNRFLGGYRSLRKVVRPYLRGRRGMKVHVLDIGTGLADIPVDLVLLGDRMGVDVRVTAVEGNAVIARAARSHLKRRLPSRLRSRIQLIVRDVWSLEDDEVRCDVAVACMFLHHLEDEAVVELLRRMQAGAHDGIVVVDLHRHPFALGAIRTISSVSRASHVFRHDAAISVLRGFRRHELRELGLRAHLQEAAIRWRWAFRWTLTTLESAVPPGVLASSAFDSANSRV